MHISWPASVLWLLGCLGAAAAAADPKSNIKSIPVRRVIPLELAVWLIWGLFSYGHIALHLSVPS